MLRSESLPNGDQACPPIASPAPDIYALLSPEGDRRLLLRPEFKAMFLDDLLNGSRSSLRRRLPMSSCSPAIGAFDSMRSRCRCAGGMDRDHIIPFSHGRHVVDRLPDAEPHLPGESHLVGFRSGEDILRTLLAIWDRSRTEFSPPRRLLAFASAPPAVAQPIRWTRCRKALVAPMSHRPSFHDMRYFSPHNFVGSRIDGYDSPTCVPTSLPLRMRSAAHNRISPRSGYTLKAYGCYRPQRAV